MYRSRCLSWVCTDQGACHEYVPIKVLVMSMYTDQGACHEYVPIKVLVMSMYRSRCLSWVCTDQGACHEYVPIKALVMSMYRSRCLSWVCTDQGACHEYVPIKALVVSMYRSRCLFDASQGRRTLVAGTARERLCDKRLYVKRLRFRFRIMTILRREFFSILLRSFFVQEHVPVSPFLAIAFEVLSKEPYKEGLWRDSSIHGTALGTCAWKTNWQCVS